MNTIIQSILSVDVSVNNLVYSFFPHTSYPLLTKAMNIIAIIFDPYVLGIFSIGIIAYFAYKKQWHFALLWLFSMASTIISVYILKILTHRPRPEAILTDFSFPSGHAAVNLVIFCLLYYTLREKLQKTQKILLISVFSIIVLFIGFNRLYLHAHWLSDIIGGYSIGALFFISFMHALKKYSS